MNQLSLKIYAIICLCLFRLRTWAQDDFGLDQPTTSRRSDDELTGLSGFDDMVDYRPVHIRMSDILLVIFLIVCCYVFGKIWKGCIYIILAFAAFMYFFVR
jgi:hypothetical protein